MAEIHQHLTETTINGPRTRRWVLEAAECPGLAACRMARVGIEEARTPYRRVRLRPAGSFFLACISGAGRILLDGRWQRIAGGALCMAPPRVLNAFFALPGAVWTFAWVRYDEPPSVKPLVGAGSPLRAAAGAAELARVVAGLRAEWEGPRAAPLVQHWVSLLHGLSTRMASPWHGQERLWRLWEEVSAKLADAWTLPELARRTHLSSEHLRRLCLRELGRSPMQHLTYMRMQRAQHLLETTDDKLEFIAPQVGYDSALVFSRAFKRWIGMSPSTYRASRLPAA
jgi:AraC-like DNA-binding protein